MAEATNVPIAPQDELKNLYAEKGELLTQLEIGQNKLQQVNIRLAQLLGLQVQQGVQPR